MRALLTATIAISILILMGCGTQPEVVRLPPAGCEVGMYIERNQLCWWYSENEDALVELSVNAEGDLEPHSSLTGMCDFVFREKELTCRIVGKKGTYEIIRIASEGGFWIVKEVPVGFVWNRDTPPPKVPRR